MKSHTNPLKNASVNASVLVLSAIALTVTLTLGVTTAKAQEVTLKMHQFLPPQAAVPAKILYPWADKIEAESGGRIKIERYPAMQLGGAPPQLIDQAIDGVADIIWTLPGYTPGRFPRTEAFELPFTMTNPEATSRAFWELAEDTMLDQDFKDVKVLGLWVHGPGVIHSKKPVNSIDDLNGLKLRAPTRITTSMFKDLGATPIGMPVPAMPEALSKGVIDAAVIPWEVTLPLKSNELVTNHTMFGDDALYTATFILAMNKAKYESLPDDLKAVIDKNTGAEFSAMAGKTMVAVDVPGFNQAKERGNNIINLSPDQVAEWKEATKSTIDAWVKEMDDKGFDGTGLRAQSLALIKKHSGL